jgi:Zn-dependent protease
VKGSLYLGKILGIPIQLHASWFLIAILVTWTLASGYFPQENPGWAPATYWIVGGVASILLFASVLLHELGHSVLALREKVPVKGITLFIFGGVAQIGREPPTAGAEFRIAIAGPLTSLGLAAFFGGLAVVFADFAVLAAPLAYLGSINLLLAAFNMIPGFPLDGGRVLRAALWGWRDNYRSATRWATRAGQVVAVLFIAFGAFQVLLGGWVNGLWFAFIGWYLNNAARASYQQAALQDALAGVKARNVTMERCAPISSDLRLDLLVQDHILKEGQSCFFVMDSDQPQGVVTLSDVKQVSHNQRAAITTSQIMTPVSSLSSVDADDDLWNLVQKMSEEDTSQVPVVDGGQLLGLITRDNLMNHLRLRSELAA